jgi:hypothetical protein
MVWGARAQVVTGILLVGLHEMSSDPADELIRAKIGVKLVIALAVAACAEIANGRQRRALATTDPGNAAGAGGGTTTAVLPATGLVQAAALLAILNVCVAVLWT